MLRSFNLPNKPLCMVENNRDVYIGDARGNILKTKFPFNTLDLVRNHSSPVSAICFYKDRMICGTWDGTICDDKTEVKLGKDPIKSMIVFNDKIFVSVDKMLIVTDGQINIIEKHNTFNKVYCMNEYEGKLCLGMGTGMIGTYSDKYEEFRSIHESTILSIKNGFTGSSDCTVRKGSTKIFEGNGWIRSIWDHTLFSSGKDVIENMSSIYSHEDEVMCVMKIKDFIISIGLDFCLKIFDRGLGIDADEEERLMNMLNS